VHMTISFRIPDPARLSRADELNGWCRYIENRESAALQRQLEYRRPAQFRASSGLLRVGHT